MTYKKYVKSKLYQKYFFSISEKKVIVKIYFKSKSEIKKSREGKYEELGIDCAINEIACGSGNTCLRKLIHRRSS
jgi:hypothetical protein